jgi:hypothetical protein
MVIENTNKNKLRYKHIKKRIISKRTKCIINMISQLDLIMVLISMQHILKRISKISKKILRNIHKMMISLKLIKMKSLKSNLQITLILILKESKRKIKTKLIQ